MEVDVAILGAGPAGAAAALELSRLGLKAVLIDRSVTPGWKPGEGLPPEARPLLRSLGVWDRFAGHLPSHGNASAWGSAALVERPFLLNPHGHGWHLDRCRFDALLVDAAAEAGAVLLRPAEAMRFERSGGRWHLDFGIDAATLVDATGRSAWLARRLGAVRRQADHLVAACCVLADPAASDPVTLVEAVPHGWWYTAPLPGARRVAMFFSDADLPQMHAARTWAGWLELVRSTCHLQALADHRPLLLGPILAPAGSTRLADPAGDGWIAVGDAAAAFDPLSSQGIMTALAAGREGARAIANGNPGAYRDSVAGVWQRYERQRAQYYSLERRWPDAPFWRRRLNPTL